MLFQSALPGITLKDVVINYWQAAYPISDDTALPPPQIPAAVSLHLVFNLKKVFKVRMLNGEVYTVPQCFIRGHLTEPLILEEMLGTEAFCINLKPSAAFHLWGLPVQKYTNTPVSLADVFGKEGEALIQKVMEAKNFEDRVSIGEEFLSNALSKTTHYSNQIDYCLDYIEKSRGVCSVELLAEKASLSSRQFDRKFIQQVGLSPKTYLRIIRINYMISELRNEKRINWQDVIHKYGYFDQSHFIKDFQKQTGVLPKNYFKDSLYCHAQHFIVKP